MTEDSQNPKPKQIRFVYEKARHHRALHADGVWAGITPQLEVQFAFFNNLRQLPISETRQVQEDDTLGDPSQEESPDIVRQVDVTVVMNVKTTKAMIGVLQDMVERAEAIIAEQKATRPVDETGKEKDTERVQ